METGKARKLREAAAGAEEDAIRAIESEGVLRHLHGKPLDLSDASPTWFLNRLLKEEGYSHPLIERGRDVDELEQEVARILDTLSAARSRLTRPDFTPTAEQVEGFNARRSLVLHDYRSGLVKLNRAITYYNLRVPERLHRMPVLIEDRMERVSREIPPIGPPVSPPPRPGRWKSALQRMRRLLAPE